MKNIQKYILIGFFCFFNLLFFSQSTSGTLTFTYTPVSHGASSYVIVTWIGNAAGSAKTLNRYCDNTARCRLSTYAAGASCGIGPCTAAGQMWDTMSASCRNSGAILGGPLNTYDPITSVWDGAIWNGVQGSDGLNSVSIVTSWGPSNSQHAYRYFDWQRGPSVDNQTTGIPNDANFTNISLIWQPTLAVNNYNVIEAIVAPNPSNSGVYNIVCKNEVTGCKVFNLLGALVYQDKNIITSGATKNLDLSSLTNGLYLMKLYNDNATSNYKLELNQ